MYLVGSLNPAGSFIQMVAAFGFSRYVVSSRFSDSSVFLSGHKSITYHFCLWSLAAPFGSVNLHSEFSISSSLRLINR